ncbi:hypothetical protein JCM10908_000900 [Rhodotorula pacifica]|uniref:transcription initiation factor TFIID subunit 4 n=1 Tax=Rhodotorula pacifica TaxID=1495444 RepID=UPI003178C258
MASRTATPQSWDPALVGHSSQPGQGQGQGQGQAQAQGQTLQLPQAATPATKGKMQAAAGQAGRGPSADPEGNAAGPSEPARATDVDSLMDAVGASGVDLGAEEESLRATNERLHAQAMAAQASAQAMNPNAYVGIDRLRKQDFIDPGVLAEVVKKVAAAFQLKTLEPDTIPFIALATRHRLEALITAAVAARDHRQSSSHFRPPPLVAPTARKRRRRDPLDPELDDAEGDEDEEMEDVSDQPKVPAWDTLVYDDPERYLTVLERVDRDEERKKRRERMLRDQKEQEERELAEAMAAAEAAQRALDSDGGGGSSKKDESGGGSTPAEEKKADSKGKGKAKDKDGAPATPSGKGGADSPALGKDGKPKKARPKKPKAGEAGSGASTPLPAGGSGVKNLSEDVRKRLTDQHALRSLGGQKFSWLNAGVGSPSPAGMGGPGGFGTPTGLPKPKFATASSLPPPSFAPLGNATTSTSGLNPANNAPSTPVPSRLGAGGSSASNLANALTTSRLNVPQLHDAQRTQIAKDAWEAGHHVVELPDLLFALERERGMGVGRGSGKNSAVKGRAGLTRPLGQGGGPAAGKMALGGSQGR